MVEGTVLAEGTHRRRLRALEVTRVGAVMAVGVAMVADIIEER